MELRKKVTGNRDFRGCSQARTGMAGGENASECRAPPHAFMLPVASHGTFTTSLLPSVYQAATVQLPEHSMRARTMI